MPPTPQRAKKVVSDSPRLVDFVIGLLNSVINLPDGQVKFFEEFKLQKNCEINLLIKTFLGLVEMMFGLVNVSFSLPEWQAVKMTFFAPCPVKSSMNVNILFIVSKVVAYKCLINQIFNFIPQMLFVLQEYVTCHTYM